VLHLFAYTGASTLAAAAAGAGEVVHVDAARNTVAWARRNAELSGLSDAPVRWVVEDARKFVRRELRRGNGYDAVILDPPSYGHGRRGEVWRLVRDLGPLLAGCAELTAGRRGFVLLTAHTPEFDATRLARMLGEAISSGSGLGQRFAMPQPPGALESATMTLRAADGRELPSGAVVRWHSGPGGTPRTK
jgi:23S rRNA (cytosine1962-C5)-methyltransferase